MNFGAFFLDYITSYLQLPSPTTLPYNPRNRERIAREKELEKEIEGLGNFIFW